MSVPPVLTPTSRLRAGVAWADITPPGDVYHRLWGAARHDRATGVHRPLRATALTLEPLVPTSPQDRHYLIALDLCLLRPPEMEEIRKATAAASGIPLEQITFTFSHTHSSGNFSRERSSFPGGERIGPYLEALPATLAKLIHEAAAALADSMVTYGMTDCGMGHNRDLADSARGQFVCGFNPEAPAGIPLTVARLSDAKGRIQSTIVNYACHPTTLAWENTLISPDYIGALRETVETATGAPCLFLLAPCGDIGPRRGFVGDPSVADRNGRQVGYAALSLLEAMPPSATDFHYAGPVFSGATLGIWEDRPQLRDRSAAAARFDHRRLVVPLNYLPQQPSVAQIEAALDLTLREEEAAREANDEPLAARLRAQAERHRRHLERVRQLPEGRYPYEVHLWRIGDAFWIILEGEPYHALQQELIRRFPAASFLMAVLADGARPSYLPERNDYGKPLYQAEIAVLAPGSLEALIDAVAAEMRTMIERAAQP